MSPSVKFFFFFIIFYAFVKECIGHTNSLNSSVYPNENNNNYYDKMRIALIIVTGNTSYV